MTLVLADDSRLIVRSLAAERFAATTEVSERFFDEHADAISRACHAMARQFQRGGRLFVCGDGAQRSDVAHVVVEFVHPVVVGKRALPAIALPDVSSGAARRMLDVMGRHEDLVMLLTAGAPTGVEVDVLVSARARGMLAIALTGPADSAGIEADHLFVVPSRDPYIVQETHEMLYHVLWELVHLFFDHRSAAP